MLQRILLPRKVSISKGYFDFASQNEKSLNERSHLLLISLKNKF